MEKRLGSTIEPWGTPQSRGTDEDIALYLLISRGRKEINQKQPDKQEYAQVCASVLRISNTLTY